MSEWKGKDGGYYKDRWERNAADNRWEQQQEQNRLLEKQNKLLEEQGKEIIRKEEEIKRQKINEERSKRLDETFNRRLAKNDEMVQNIQDKINVASLLTNYNNEEKEKRKEKEEKISILKSKIELYDKVQKTSTLEEIENIMIEIHDNIEYTEKLLKDKEMTAVILKKLALQEEKKLQQELDELELIDYENECNRIIEKFNLDVNEKTFETYTYEELYNKLPTLIEEQIKKLDEEIHKGVSEFEEMANPDSKRNKLLKLAGIRGDLIVRAIQKLRGSLDELIGDSARNGVEWSSGTGDYRGKKDTDKIYAEKEQIIKRKAINMMNKSKELLNQLNVTINVTERDDLFTICGVVCDRAKYINEMKEISLDKNWSNKYIKELLMFEGNYLIDEKLILNTLIETNEINKEYIDNKEDEEQEKLQEQKRIEELKKIENEEKANQKRLQEKEEKQSKISRWCAAFALISCLIAIILTIAL